jgi:hypothetical protein
MDCVVESKRQSIRRTELLSLGSLDCVAARRNSWSFIDQDLFEVDNSPTAAIHFPRRQCIRFHTVVFVFTNQTVATAGLREMSP